MTSGFRVVISFGAQGLALRVLLPTAADMYRLYRRSGRDGKSGSRRDRSRSRERGR